MGYQLTWMYIGSQKVRPTGWTPWADTVLYFPFTEDMNDHSGNSYTVSCDFGSIVDGYFYNGSATKTVNWLVITDMPSGLETSWFTINFWEKKTAYASNTQAVFASNSWGSQPHSLDFGNKIRFWIWGWNNDPTVPDNWLNVWRMLSYVYGGTTTNDFNLYINWSLISTATRTGVTIPAWQWRFFSWWGTYYPLMGYASQLIMEKKPRTAQDLADYFDSTKWNYWIS